VIRAALLLLAALAGGGAAAQTPAAPASTATAIFAGGCFWCVEADFDKLPGVTATESGYIGGSLARPTYEQVSAGGTGHAEAVRITYDPARVSYARLLEYFWRHIDPTVKDGQFCDMGSQYRSAVFYLDAAQRRAAEASREALLKSGRFARIHTEIAAAGPFHPAEAYHQDYYLKNPLRYNYYRSRCGRDARVRQVWEGKP
jgi:peptide-methionine (S)-S-oxide reductase